MTPTSCSMQIHSKASHWLNGTRQHSSPACPLARYLYSGHHIYSLVSHPVKSVSFRLNLECLCYSHWPIEYGSRDIMRLLRWVLKRFFTFCFYFLGMLPSHKRDWNGSWRERGAQLSQMYQLRSDFSQPLAKRNILLEPRQKCQQKNHLVNPRHFDTLLICCYFKPLSLGGCFVFF